MCPHRAASLDSGVSPPWMGGKSTGMGGLGAWVGGGQQSASFTWECGKDKRLKWEGRRQRSQDVPPALPGQLKPALKLNQPPAPALRAARASLPATTTAWLGTDRLLFALENVRLIGKSQVWDGGVPRSPQARIPGGQGGWHHLEGPSLSEDGEMSPARAKGRKEGRKDVQPWL